MNNRGFTLVEILATITLLGVLVTIAVPSIIYVNKNIKEKTYKTEKDLVLLASEEYAREENYKLFDNNNCIILNTQTLIDGGYYKLDKEIINPTTNKNIKDLKIYVEKNNNKYNSKIIENKGEDNNCKNVAN